MGKLVLYVQASPTPTSETSASESSNLTINWYIRFSDFLNIILGRPVIADSLAAGSSSSIDSDNASWAL